jgi:hypothetical protein
MEKNITKEIMHRPALRLSIAKSVGRVVEQKMLWRLVMVINSWNKSCKLFLQHWHNNDTEIVFYVVFKNTNADRVKAFAATLPTAKGLLHQTLIFKKIEVIDVLDEAKIDKTLTADFVGPASSSRANKPEKKQPAALSAAPLAEILPRTEIDQR